MQVGEFELKLNTCSHKNADGSSALGEAIKTVEATCIEHGYTTHECSICHSIVKVDKDELNKHTLTRHAQEDATCLETGKKNTGSAVYVTNSSATIMLLPRLRMLPALRFPPKVINTIAKASVLDVAQQNFAILCSIIWMA